MKKILLVDDDDDDIEYLTDILQQEFEIIIAQTSHDAVRMVEEEHFDLILIDVYLPGIDGFDTIRIMQASLGKIEYPYLFITGERDASIELECIETGADEIINKPFNKNLIISKIRKVVEEYTYKNSLEKKVEINESEIEQAVTLSKTDSLTGLYNRTGGMEKWRKLILEYDSMTIFMLDIDNFKRINDTFGHVAGDEALKALADVFNGMIDEEDIVIRLGGDEFILVFAKSLTESHIQEVANNIRRKCAKKLDEIGYGDIATVSAGVVRYPIDGKTVEELYSKADKALYTVKVNGKDNYHIYDEFIDENARETNVEMKNIIYTVEGHLDTRDGAYQVEYNDFKKLYNFVKRYIRRYRIDVKLVVFTLSKNTIVTMDELKREMTALESAINYSLRSSDVFTKYNSSQCMTLLMNLKEKDTQKVIDRVINEYNKYLGDENVELTYDVKSINIDED